MYNVPRAFPSVIIKSIQLIPLLNFRNNKFFLLCGVVKPTPNPQPGGPGYPFLSGSSPLTRLAWEVVQYVCTHTHILCCIILRYGVSLHGHISRRVKAFRYSLNKEQGGRQTPSQHFSIIVFINPLNAELNPICYLLALLVAHHFLHVSSIRVKLLTFRRLMSYIYGAPILDVSRSHTTTQHSR